MISRYGSFRIAPSMAGYIFDLSIEKANIRPDIASMRGYVWCQFHIDGVSRPVITPKVPLGEFAIWNYQARLTLNIGDISQCHMFCHLCVETLTHQRTIVARSKMPISHFPSSVPKKYRIPLIQPKDNTTRVADIGIKATLTPFRGPASMSNWINPLQVNNVLSKTYPNCANMLPLSS